MPPPDADHNRESDPLLDFNVEPGAESPAKAATGDSPATETLQMRIDQLERELATLVRVVEDIRKRPARPLERKAPPPPAPPSQPRHASRAIAMIGGAVAGIALGAWGWIAVTSTPPPEVEPAPIAAVTDAPQPEPAPRVIVAPPVTAPAIVQAAAPLPSRARAPEPEPEPVVAPQRRSYVGTLSVDADPGGDVFLNRRNVGHTPLRLTDLKAGSHLIWIEREGYRRFTRVVQVPADRVSRVWASLERADQ